MIKKTPYLVFVTMAVGALFLSIHIQRAPQPLGFKNMPTLSVGTTPVFADMSSCISTMQGTFQKIISSLTNPYTNGALQFFHFQDIYLNYIAPMDATMSLCAFVNDMGMNPNLSSLPQTDTKTFADPSGTSHTISLNVVSPTETWAPAGGYQAKATVSMDGTQFMALWWKGSGTTSKGYMISQDGIATKETNMHSLKYLLWDLTTSSQSLYVLAAQFASTYLGSYAAQSSNSFGGDTAQYGRLSFNTATKAITTQSINIMENQADNAFGCYRMEGAGTLGGTVSVYTSSGGGSTPATDPVTNTDTTGTGMLDFVNLTDSTTTANTIGTPGGSMNENFDISCNTLNVYGSSGHPFASNAVNFSADPRTVFSTVSF